MCRNSTIMSRLRPEWTQQGQASTNEKIEHESPLVEIEARSAYLDFQTDKYHKPWVKQYRIVEIHLETQHTNLHMIKSRKNVECSRKSGKDTNNEVKAQNQMYLSKSPDSNMMKFALKNSR